MPKHLAGSNGSTSNKIYGQLVGSPSPSGARPNQIGKSKFFPGHVVHSRPRVRGGRLYIRYHATLWANPYVRTYRMSAFQIPLQVLHQYVGAMSHTLASLWAWRVCQIINWWDNSVQKGFAENNTPYLRLNKSRSTSESRPFNLFVNPGLSEPRAQGFSSKDLNEWNRTNAHLNNR